MAPVIDAMGKKGAESQLYGGFVRADVDADGVTSKLKATVGLGGKADLNYSGHVFIQYRGDRIRSDNVHLNPGEQTTLTWESLSLPDGASIGLQADVVDRDGDDAGATVVTLAGATLPADAEEINRSHSDENQERIEALEQEVEEQAEVIEELRAELDGFESGMQSRLDEMEQRIEDLEQSGSSSGDSASAEGDAEVDVGGGVDVDLSEAGAGLADFFFSRLR